MQMYLSRIRLNTRKRNTAIALSNPQKFHGAIESAFMEDRERNLWRIDNLGNELYLLLLSQHRPELSGIVKQFGYDEEPAETKTYEPLLDKIVNGSRWQFRLTANPTKCIKKGNDDALRGKVKALVSVEQQEQWLFDHADAYGFALKPGDFRVTRTHTYTFKKQGKHRVSIHSVTFDGVLTVIDSEKFLSALTSGIGRGKAYGNGLLTVVRTKA